MKIKTEAHMLGIEDKSFTKQETGELIEYREATFVVDGEVFHATVAKDAEVDSGEGKALLTLDISERNNKLKMRLVESIAN